MKVSLLHQVVLWCPINIWSNNTPFSASVLGVVKCKISSFPIIFFNCSRTKRSYSVWIQKYSACKCELIIYIYIANFCHGTSLKKSIWPRGDSNLRCRSQSTNMLYALDHHASPKKDASSPELSRVNHMRVTKV